jgi:hypothetical protein
MRLTLQVLIDLLHNGYDSLNDPILYKSVFLINCSRCEVLEEPQDVGLIKSLNKIVLTSKGFLKSVLSLPRMRDKFIRIPSSLMIAKDWRISSKEYGRLALIISMISFRTW